MSLEEAREHNLAEAIAAANILVTTGAGGVGKTTTAAALGLAAASAGRRALVLTIDPARRLAQAMGVDHLGDQPEQMPVDGVDGELWAMMLDMQPTFDRLIDRHANTKAQARAIKQNRIYRTLSSTLSGTHEYMAMERLHELHDTGEWDLLIIDTPPTRSALDFLDAPKRMTTFLEGRLLTLLLKPGMIAGKGIGKVVGVGATAFMKVAGKVTGTDLLSDLADFFRNFDGMYEGFKARAEQVLELLRQPTSQFVVVSSPQPPPLREARFFLERLQQEGLHAAGVVVNRMRPQLPRDPSARAIDRAAQALEGGPRRNGHNGDDEHGNNNTEAALDEAAVAGALRLLGDSRTLAGRAERDIAAALYNINVPALVDVPLLDGDVHDLDGLGRIAETLTGR